MRQSKNALILVIGLAAASAGFAGSASAVTNLRGNASATMPSSTSSIPTSVTAWSPSTSARSGSVVGNDRAIIVVGGKPNPGGAVSLNPQPLPPRTLRR